MEIFQKNPQIMYLEQELESLKAVLEIKNEKLHQQDVKLMKMDKLVGFPCGLAILDCFSSKSYGVHSHCRYNFVCVGLQRGGTECCKWSFHLLRQLLHCTNYSKLVWSYLRASSTPSPLFYPIS